MPNQIYARRQFGGPSHLQTRASMENPRFNLNDPQALDLLRDGPPAASGIPVSHDRAMHAAAVWQCVQQISGDIAKLPLNVKSTSGDGEIDLKHPAQRLVRYRWNEDTPAFHGWRTLVAHALIWGNGYAFIDRNGRGDPIGLYTLLPDRTRPERVGGQLWYVTETSDGKVTPIHRDDVIHLRGLTLDGLSGMDLVKYARDAIGTALETEGFQAKFFKNGIRHGGILMLPREMADQVKDKVETGFRRAYSGGDNAFKTIILRDGAKFEAAQSTFRDAQMVELDEQLVRKIARFFNVAPSRVGLSDSVSYNSKAEDNQSYLDTTLSPWMLALCAELWCKLLSLAQQQALSHELAHDVAQLLRLDRLKRYQIYAIGKRSRILTTNDCRADDGLPPIEGGDELDPVPTKPAGGADKGGATPPRGAADPSGGEAPAAGQDAGRGLAWRRIVFDLASQARHKASSLDAFGKWLAGGLLQHRARVKQVDGSEARAVEIIDGLKAVLAAATADTLAAEVDRYVTQLEAQA